MKRFLALLVFGVSFFSPVLQAQEDDVVNVYFFHAKGCPHCAKEIEFLNSYRSQAPIKIWDYEITKNRENIRLLQSLEDVLDARIPGTPYTVVGETSIAGFMSVETTGQKIRDAVGRVLAGEESQMLSDVVTNQPDGMFELETGDPQNKETTEQQNKKEVLDGDIREKIKLPIIGVVVETRNLSLPVLTFVIALLDGFNPCAMWVLIFLISLLFGMKDRKRMWILGSAFILASGFVYFMIMSAWLKVILLLGFVFWLRLAIGFLALGVGGWYLYDAITNKEGQCKVSHSGNRQKVFAKLKTFAQHPNLWIALGGIILLAFAVNVVEAVCSAGLPVVFNGILVANDLPQWQYYAYLAFYILIFMLDDLIVFGIAMMTLKYANLNTKYARYSHLVGGIIMLLLGLLLIFKPEWLMFG